MGAMLDKSSRAEERTEVTLSLPKDVVEAAREHDLDASAIAEEALRRAGAEARRQAWLEENREALAERDAWIEKNGLPLEDYRLF